jgi:hypothetical protein
MSVYDPRGSTPVHMDRVLTQMSLGWPNGEFVGPAFFPALPVRKQSDKYYVFGREAWAPPLGGDLRAPGSEAIEVMGLTVSTQPYFAQEHALQIGITDEEQENQDAPLNSLRDGTELITSQLLLVRELYIKNLITTAANFTSGHSVTLAGADQWSSAVSASNSPIGDHRLARSTIHSKIFLEPNTELIPYQVMAALEDHNEIIERIKYSERAILTPELMSNFFGGQRIIVPGVGYNTANPGQTAALGYIWGKDVVMAYVPPRPGMKIPAFGYEFVWSYPGGQLQLVERWRETVRVRDVVRVRRRYDIRFVAVDGSNDSIAGYLIKAAVA